MIIPATLTVPETETEVLGFRPGKLPPIQASCIRLVNIMPNSWAARAGLNPGDLLTHVEGVAVSSILSASDFYQTLSRRPLNLSFLLQVDEEDLAAANKEVLALKQYHGVGSVNDVFNRLFGEDVNVHKASSLFEASNYKVKGVANYNYVNQLLPGSQIFYSRPSDTTSALQPESPVMSSNKPSLPSSPFNAVKPYRLHVHVISATGVPSTAGALASDPIVQPFSSDPFVSFYVTSPPDVHPSTLEDLRNACKPLGPIKRTRVDRNLFWNERFVFTLSEKIEISRLALVFWVQDQRLFTEPADFGSAIVRFGTGGTYNGGGVPVWGVSESGGVGVRELTFIGNPYYSVANMKIKVKLFIEGLRDGEQRPSHLSAPSIRESSETAHEQKEEVIIEVGPELAAAQQTTTEDDVNEEVRSDGSALEEDVETDTPWMYRSWERAVQFKRDKINSHM